MGSLKKFDGSSWINSNLRKLTTDTDTFTTFPAIIYAEGTNATVGLKGNTTQSGTPSPDSPVMPQGTGERTGNLSNVSEYTNDNTDTRTYLALKILMSKNGSQTETFSSSMRGIGEKSFSFTLTTEADTMRIVHNGSQRNLFIEELTGEFSGTYTYSFDLESNDPTTIGGLELNDIMLNSGSTPLPYEPYGYKIPISSANTTTPVYLGEVQTTRKIGKLVLTGEENWYTEGSDVFYTDPITEAVRYTPICSHFIGVNTLTDNNQVTISQPLRINIKTTTITHTANDFKTYLTQQYAAGTPVCVWYVLANPETAVVTEPLMKIGDYADTVSGISIPVTAGGDTLSVGTTVQPSEVTANYYGWHTITVHERESGQWD